MVTEQSVKKLQRAGLVSYADQINLLVVVERRTGLQRCKLASEQGQSGVQRLAQFRLRHHFEHVAAALASGRQNGSRDALDQGVKAGQINFGIGVG